MKELSVRDARRTNRYLVPRSPTLAARALPTLLALYCAASFVHFWHNAEFLMDYPNLPAWLTRADVYGVWLGITAIGVVGYVLLRARWQLEGALRAVSAFVARDGVWLCNQTRELERPRRAASLKQRRGVSLGPASS